MRNRSFLILAVLSIGIAVIQAETEYADWERSTKYVRAFGYALSPWLIGSLVAAIKSGYLRLRNKTMNFAGSLIWAAGVLIAFQVAMIVYKFTAS